MDQPLIPSVPPCLHPLRVCAAGRERRRGDRPQRSGRSPCRRDYGMGPVPNRSRASVVLRRWDRPCGHGDRPHRSERLPRRRDYGVGPVPNHSLAPVALWARGQTLWTVGNRQRLYRRNRLAAFARSFRLILVRKSVRPPFDDSIMKINPNPIRPPINPRNKKNRSHPSDLSHRA